MTVTNVPSVAFTATGFIAPAESDILVGVQADQNAAFGGNLNPALTAPQGQLAQSETALIAEQDDAMAAVLNSFDPAYADGRAQDALARIYFLERNPALPTTVQAVCTGIANTVIPQFAQAVATDGNTYFASDGGVIGAGGTVTLQFDCLVNGPVACPIGTLTQIFQAIAGWDSITNLVEGILGQNAEDRANFEIRRELTVAANSVGPLPAIRGSVLKVAGVVDVFTAENDTSAPITVGGVTLIANSMYAAVVGGSDSDVATAIWKKKSPGCNYNGNTAVTVYDTSPPYGSPGQPYVVTFERPGALPFAVAVTLVNNPGIPSDASAQIAAAIIAAFAGTDGGPRARIGTTVLASRFYGPIAALGIWAQILSIEVGSPNLFSAVVTASIAAFVMTVTGITSGVLAPGQNIGIGTTGVVDGTTIINQLTGSTGGTGTYTVSNTQTVTSRTVNAVAPNLFSVATNIDQAPTVSAPDISLTLV